MLPSYSKLIPNNDEYIEIIYACKLAYSAKFTAEDVKNLVEDIKSDDKKRMYTGLIGLRKISSIGKIYNNQVFF